MIRRPGALVMVALALGVLVALSLTPAARSLRVRLIAGPRPSSGTTWLSSVPKRTLERMLEALAPPAEAQETLEFKPVPPESAAALERRSARRVTRSTDTEVDVTPPTPPTPPAVPGKTGNIMRIGSDVHIEQDQVVSGDLLAVGGDVTVDGHVEGDVVAMGGDVHLSASARVDGDVACIGGELTEDPGASIGGQRVTAMGLRGTRHFRSDRFRPGRHDDEWRGFWSATKIATSFIWLFIFGVIAWGFASLAPGRTAAAHDVMKKQPALSMGIGMLVWALFVPSVVALALVVAILCITIIGIPLALAALFGYFVFLGILAAWGYAVSAVGVGDLVSRRVHLGAPAITAPGAPPATVSLSRKAVLGVLVLSGSGLVGEFLHALFFAPPLQGIGVFIAVVSKIATVIAGTFGAGALLRHEAIAGTLRRWWAGRGAARSAEPSPIAATPVVEPVPPAPPA